MRLLLACDKFKNCLSAREVNAALAEGLSEIETLCLPVSDGGEGFLDTVNATCSLRWQSTPVISADGRSITARWGLDAHNNAWVETALICGHATVRERPLRPLTYTSAGVGMLLAHLARRNVKHIYLGLGSSAIMDGGMGAVEVLQRELQKYAVSLPEVTCIADVDNPLLGERGGLRVYGPQKGANLAEIQHQEEHLSQQFERWNTTTFRTLLQQKHGGAAGGLGLGLAALYKVHWQGGARWCIAHLDLTNTLKNCDGMVIGEGCVDASSLEGKITGSLYALARHLKKPVIWVCGQKSPGVELEKVRAQSAYSGASHEQVPDGDTTRAWLKNLDLLDAFEQLADHGSISKNVEDEEYEQQSP